MSVKRFWPDSPADSMTRSPAPITRSMMRCPNVTSLIVSSGISFERFAMTPERVITRSLVSTNSVKRHRIAGTNASGIHRTNAIPTIGDPDLVLNVAAGLHPHDAGHDRDDDRPQDRLEERDPVRPEVEDDLLAFGQETRREGHGTMLRQRPAVGPSRGRMIQSLTHEPGRRDLRERAAAARRPGGARALPRAGAARCRRARGRATPGRSLERDLLHPSRRRRLGPPAPAAAALPADGARREARIHGAEGARGDGRARSGDGRCSARTTP